MAVVYETERGRAAFFPAKLADSLNADYQIKQFLRASEGMRVFALPREYRFRNPRTAIDLVGSVAYYAMRPLTLLKDLSLWYNTSHARAPRG
jgi:hypothetical protein